MGTHEVPIKKKKARISALAEVGLVFLFFNILKPSHYLLHRSGILKWELEHLGWSYLGGALLIAIPVLLILLKHQPLRDYGIHLEFIDLSLDLGLKGYLASFIPWLAGFGLLMGIGSGYDRPAGALVLSSCYLLAAWLLFRWTRNFGTTHTTRPDSASGSWPPTPSCLPFRSSWQP